MTGGELAESPAPAVPAMSFTLLQVTLQCSRCGVEVLSCADAWLEDVAGWAATHEREVHGGGG